MGSLTASLNERPAFEPYIDANTGIDYSTYGESDSDHDHYFIYNSAKIYTGMSVPASKQYCNAATDFFDFNKNPRNRDLPEYLDNVFVWDNSPAFTKPGEPDCVDTPVNLTLREDSVQRNNWETLNDSGAPLSVIPGKGFTLTFQARRSGQTSAYFRDASDDRIQTICSSVTNSANQTVTCATGIVPAEAVYIEVRHRRSGSAGWFGARWAEAYLATTDEQCTPTTVNVPASGNWKDKVANLTDTNPSPTIDNSSVIEGIECSADSGIHGIGTSADTYAQYFDEGAADTPNYSPNVSDVVPWSIAPSRYLVKGNYHDYLQTPVSKLVGTGFSVTQLPVIIQ